MAKTFISTELSQFLVLEELGVEPIKFRNIEGSIVLMEFEQVLSHLLVSAERTFPALVGTLEVSPPAHPLLCTSERCLSSSSLYTPDIAFFGQRSHKNLAAAALVDRAITNS